MLPIHPDVLEAMEQIDAAVFSGDAFRFKRHRRALREKLEGWMREVERLDLPESADKYRQFLTGTTLGATRFVFTFPNAEKLESFLGEVGGAPEPAIDALYRAILEV